MEFLGIGIPELLVIIVLALIVVGPERLPEVMVKIARAVNDIRAYTTNITQEFNTAIEEMQEEFKDVSNAAKEGVHSINDQFTSVETEVRSAGAAASEEPTVTTTTTEEATAAPEQETEETAAVASGSASGVASLDEIRRRVLRSTNGSVKSPHHGPEDGTNASGDASVS